MRTTVHLHSARFARQPLAIALTLACVSTFLMGPFNQSTAAAEPRATTSRPVPGVPHTVTLLTGDRVTYQDLPDGTAQVVVDPAPRANHAHVVFTTSTTAAPGQRRPLLVVPSDARRYVAAGVLDRALFDVRKLTAEGLDDKKSATLPVIVKYRGKAPVEVPLASRRTRALPAVRGSALRIDRRRAAQFWATLKPPRPVTGIAPPTLQMGVAKVWLDHRVRVSVDASVPQIGAPSAWRAGYDGAGVKVAVLDTGVDLDHADLRGKVTSAVDFSESGSPADRHGHGTHVAATITGTGAASQGRYRGVAPGATLMVGKVLGDDGSGWDSSVIAGMEWAARGGANVVNMSIGGEPTDGTDPLSEALNSLTAETGALFVVAAGNSGASTTVAAPGAADAALTVAAVDRGDRLASFSSRGPRLGDAAVKPDISAPGVGIVAARATGTLAAGALNDNYAAMSGTSMAAPHVSGAAAILAQRHPRWRATQLKDGLVSAATDAGGSWSHQGAGRVDVARAVRQTVTGPSAINLGRLPSSSAATRRPVTYTNNGTSPVTLELSLSFAGWNGAPAPSRMARLSHPRVSVPAGRAAPVEVVLDTTAAPGGAYGGFVLARTADGSVALRSPLAMYLTADTAEVTVRVTDHRGQPAPFATVSMIDAAYDPATDNDPFATPLSSVLVNNGTGIARVRRGGVYTALTSQTTYALATRRVDVMVTPEVTVEGNTEIVLDARRGEQHQVVTADTTDELMHATEVVRTTAGAVVSLLTAIRTDPLLGVYVSPTGTPRLGYLDTYDKRTFAAAGLRLETTTGAGAATTPRTPSTPLHPSYDPYRTPPMLAGHRVAPVTWAGEGRPADLADVKLRGRLALVGVRIPAGVENPIGYASQTAAAATRAVARTGATAVLLYVDVPGSLPLPRPSANPLPQLFVSRDEGVALRNQLLRSPVLVELTGSPTPRAMYNLLYPHAGVPAGHTDVAIPAKLVAIPTRYHADRAMTYENNWYAFGSRSRAALRERVLFQAPTSRIEYVGPGDSTVRWNRWVTQNDQRPNSLPLIASLIGRDRYAASDRQQPEERWYEGPILENEPAGSSTDACGLCRGGPTGDLLIPAWHLGDSTEGHTIQSWPDYRSDVKVFRGSVEVPAERLTNELPMPTFRLGRDPETYRMVVDGPFPWNPAVRPIQHTSTEWMFRSAPHDGPGQRCPGTMGGQCAHQPLIQVKYRLGLDLANRAPAGRPFTFTVSATLPPTAPGAGRIAGLRLWSSTDAGLSWHPAGTTAQADGRYLVTVAHPAAVSGASAAVWLKVEAWDSAGNRVQQLVRGAYTLLRGGGAS